MSQIIKEIKITFW